MDTIIISPPKRSLLIQATGFLFFGFLFFLCWHYYKERMLLFDGAFNDFMMIQQGFSVGAQRYGDLIGEFLPWLALKMGCRLSTIILCHSIGFMLFHYGIFLFITLKLKNDGAGIAVMLVSCLAYARAFYFPMEEINESFVLAVLLWAIIHPEFPYITNKQKNIAAAGAFLTIVLISFFHPLGIFLIAFALGCEMVLNKRYNDIRLWLIAIFGIGWFLLKTQVLFISQYDSQRTIPFSVIIHQLPQWKNWNSTRFFLSLSYKHFLSFVLLTIGCLLLSLRKGLPFFLFCTMYFFLYTIIYIGTFYKGDASWSLECYYTVYGFFTGILFICLFYRPAIKNLTLLIALPFLWIGAHRIYISHRQFTYRLSYLSRIINDARENGMKKCFVDFKCYPGNYAEGEWNVAIETLLYSSLASPDSSVSIFITESSSDSICRVNQDKPNILFGAQFAPLWFTTNSLSQKYLRLPPTGYSYLTHPQADTSFHDTAFSAKNIKIFPLQQTINAYLGDWVAVLPMKILNTSGKIIPAIPRDKNPVELSYHIYDKDGNSKEAYLPTAFETDIKNEEVCGLIIYLPFEKGTFYVMPDIITGNNWWNIPTSMIKVVIN